MYEIHISKTDIEQWAKEVGGKPQSGVGTKERDGVHPRAGRTNGRSREQENSLAQERCPPQHH